MIGLELIYLGGVEGQFVDCVIACIILVAGVGLILEATMNIIGGDDES